jgi:hypothetical protein
VPPTKLSGSAEPPTRKAEQFLSLEAVLGLLHDNDPKVQYWATCEAMMRGLEERGDDKQLLAVVFSSDASLRERAARALGRRHSELAARIEEVISRLQSRDELRWKGAATQIHLFVRWR